MTTALSHRDARRVYDRIGSFQDSQAFYEDRTTRELVTHGCFEKASAVFEFGCGTGRFAESLLAERLPATATYRGIDLSPTMIGLASRRLARFGARAEVALSEGGPPVDEPSGHYDRWLSNFVFDLLSEDDIAAVLAEAHRMLKPGGLLCLASLGTGNSWYSHVIAGVWSTIHRMAPEVVGGCRPIDLLPFLAADRWSVAWHRSLAPFLVPSDAVVATRL
ncbi:MAG TPA: class I SAM-dependent methyltransferase [Candidatus Limnocylindrales bacterium]|nr:class I SAM-dependent methyltransferase [Candidatus Limnocylindrales bacterium]